MDNRSRMIRVLVTFVPALLLFNYGNVIAQTQQEHVHNMSHGVMPFDMAKSVHIFKMTESGASNASL